MQKSNEENAPQKLGWYNAKMNLNEVSHDSLICGKLDFALAATVKVSDVNVMRR